MHTNHPRLARLTMAAALLLFGFAGCSSSNSTVEVDAGPVALRRLTAEQFARSIHDVLRRTHHGAAPHRPRRSAIGASRCRGFVSSVTPSGFEKYEAAAAAVAEQALDASHRDDLVPCQPAAVTTSDEACARTFIERVGRRLFRRSLSQTETDARVDIANQAANTLRDFYAGLELGLMSLLVSPEFLFRVELAESRPCPSVDHAPERASRWPRASATSCGTARQTTSSLPPERTATW